MVDTADKERLDKSKTELFKSVMGSKLQDQRILVHANKQVACLIN